MSKVTFWARSHLSDLTDSLLGRFRKARCAEYLGLPALQIARLRAAARLSHLHSRGGGALRRERAERFFDAVDPAPARRFQLDSWVTVCGRGRISWSGEPLDDTDWFPLGTVRALLSAPERSVAVDVVHDQNRLMIAFVVTGDPIATIELDQMARGLAGIGAVVERMGRGAGLNVVFDRDHIDDRVTASVADAASQSGIHAASFRPSEKDPATYVSIGDNVVKLRLRFLHSRRAATLHDEWTTLRVLSDHPGVVRPTAYRAEAGWETLTMPRLVGEALDVWNEAGQDRTSVRRMLLRLLDISARLTAAGVVHRDLLPHNLIVGADERLTLIDFDEAVAVHRADIPSRRAPHTVSYDLLPWAGMEDLVEALGWQRSLDEILSELDASSALLTAGDDDAKDAAHGSFELWSRWHAVAGAADALAGHSIDVIGPTAPLFCELLSVWAIGESAQPVGQIFQGLNRGPTSKPTALIALGPGTTTTFPEQMGDYGLALIELSRLIHQVREIRAVGFELSPLPGPLPVVMVRRPS